MMYEVTREVSPADDQPGIAEVECLPMGASQSAYVGQHSPIPKERMFGLIVGQEGNSDDLTMVVESIWYAAGTSQTFDVVHNPAFPQESILCRDVRRAQRAVIAVRN